MEARLARLDQHDGRVSMRSVVMHTASCLTEERKELLVRACKLTAMN